MDSPTNIAPQSTQEIVVPLWQDPVTAKRLKRTERLLREALEDFGKVLSVLLMKTPEENKESMSYFMGTQLRAIALCATLLEIAADGKLLVPRDWITTKAE